MPKNPIKSFRNFVRNHTHSHDKSENTPEEELKTSLEEIKSIKIVAVGNRGVGTSHCNTVLTATNPKDASDDLFSNKSYLQGHVKDQEHKGKITVRENNINISFDHPLGHEDNNLRRPRSYDDANAFTINFDITDRESFEAIETKWIPELRHHQPKVPIILVGNKSDLAKERQVTQEEIEILAKKVGAVGYSECSALTCDGIQDTLNMVAATGIHHAREGEVKNANQAIDNYGLNTFANREKSARKVVEQQPNSPGF